MKFMRITVARLRRVIVVMACLLLAVLAGFFLYARYRFRHFEKDLPGKLGIDVQQTANGFTVSQSTLGHTSYTIHASKYVQYKKGHAQLHDVSITLYGAPGSNRADKIYGQNFDYDQQQQIVHAQGEVQIDLSGLNSDADKSNPDKQPATPEDGQNPQNTIHIKTSNLIFNQKTGEALTGAHTEFQLPKASGNSMGASYNSKTGLLVLDSQVEIETSNNGKLAVVHATHAQLLRDSKQAFLLQPVTDYQDERSSSDQAILYFRKDGSAERIDAQGHVRVTTDNGAVITASNSQTQLDAKSQPVQVDMGGGVNFVSNDEDSSMHGNAVEGTLTFGPNSMLKHAQFRNAVSFVQQILHLANDPKGTASRQMQASKVDVDFIPGPDGKKSIAQKALGVGGAQVNLHTIPSKGAQQLTNIRGDQLLATLDPDGQSIHQLDGSGNTKIVDLAQDGSTSTSTGDQLHVTFLPQGTKQPATGKQGSQASQVDTAIQDGHVVITQTPLKKPDAKTDPATTKAWASHAEYHSADQMLHLTGDPRLDDGQSLQLSALAIDYHRETGDAIARGNVKATYTQAKTGTAANAPASQSPGLGGSGPVHITADHAFLRHSTNVSTFYGSESAMARMWQGTDSVLAPVLEISQKPQTLKAYGLPGNTAPVVNANLLSASSNQPSSDKSTSDSAHHPQSVVRVHSQTLFYSDADRRGDFQGTVTAEDANGVIHSDQAEFYLTPAVKGAAGNQQAQLDHIVATGRVTITQPGRKGTGDKLVYTEDDGKYVLTGSAGNLPRVVDAAKGTTTGATLIFNSQDDSVVVSGGQSRAVTETRTQKK
jgi:lipopolysaccharide export system protein LptA